MKVLLTLTVLLVGAAALAGCKAEGSVDTATQSSIPR